MKTLIELKNMRFYAYHGVLPQETKIGNNFDVNLIIETDFTQALESDDLRDTLNYASVFDLIKKEMQTPSKLLEHVAGRIFFELKENFPGIKIVELRVSKMNPPVSGEMEKSEIIIKE